MDIKRILTTVIGLPIVILVFLLGNKYIIGAVVFIASLICMYEYFDVIKKVCKPIKWIGYLSNLIIILATFCSLEKIMMFSMCAIPIIMLLMFLQVIITNMKTTFKDVAYTLLGIMYIPLFLMFLELIRTMENGKILIGYIFVISWSTDTFAYLIGKNFGKHKLSKISPKKTIEGAIAGIIASMVISVVYTIIANKFWGLGYNIVIILISSIMFSVISQIGDFVASTIKRFADVKDYGKIIPGHGGMLDRIDSVLFLTPFCYFLFSILG